MNELNSSVPPNLYQQNQHIKSLANVHNFYAIPPPPPQCPIIYKFSTISRLHMRDPTTAGDVVHLKAFS
jgi:hypothetical protein